MSSEFEPDLSLFRLPVPDDTDLPEQWDLGGGGFEERAAAKRAFWRLHRHEDAIRVTEAREAFQDLVSQERIESLLAPGVVGEPQPFPRPWQIDEALEECTAQLCLRNLERYELDAWVDDLWWTVNDVRETPGDVADALEPIRRADLGEWELSFVDEPSHAVLGGLRDERDEVIRRTDWRTFTWRRGPRGDDDWEGGE